MRAQIGGGRHSRGRGPPVGEEKLTARPASDQPGLQPRTAGLKVQPFGVAAFDDRDADGLPRAWRERIRASMRTLAPAFCAGRMLDDYLDRVYAPTQTSA